MQVEINPSEYTVLIVDDTIANVLLLKVLIGNQKYRIVTAGNGMEALQAVEKESPDLILLDIMMPGMNGYEVAEKLKADPQTQEIPIIFLTALNSTNDIVKGFKTGASDYISKPFNKEELLIRVTHQISLIAAKRLIASQMKELQSTIRGRDRLYSVIAHDLRSPMGSLKMIFNLLMAQLPPEKIGPEMYDMLSMANHTAEETFSLLDNLLKWTKSQIGRLKTVYQEIDMMEVIGDAVTLFSPVASLKNIKIRTEWPDHVDVRVDVDMIKTIMRNLLSNAVKYSPEGSEIIVTVEDLGEKAVVNVRDFGKGIPEEDQPKLFHSDPHFTTYGTHNEEGSGLGLLLCKDFAHKNNGDLWFSSKAGEGSTFSFSVPTRTGAAAMNASADSANAPASL